MVAFSASPPSLSSLSSLSSHILTLSSSTFLHVHFHHMPFNLCVFFSSFPGCQLVSSDTPAAAEPPVAVVPPVEAPPQPSPPPPPLPPPPAERTGGIGDSRPPSFQWAQHSSMFNVALHLAVTEQGSYCTYCILSASYYHNNGGSAWLRNWALPEPPSLLAATMFFGKFSILQPYSGKNPKCLFFFVSFHRSLWPIPCQQMINSTI